jgi:hypothetical protein
MNPTSYRCLAGHDIEEEQLEQSTELRTLDGGAVVRLCKEHGTPLSVSVGAPGDGEESDS